MARDKYGLPGIYNASPITLSDGRGAAVALDSNARAITNMGTAESQAIDSILTYPRGSNSTRLSASGLALTGAGKLTGIFVEAASATPTIQVYDNTTNSGTVLIGTFTPVAATMYTFPFMRVGTGIYVVISGTVSCVVCYDPTTT